LEKKGTIMQITLDLPDDVALRANDAGLLTVESVQRLLEEAIRRAAGDKLLSMADKLQAANIAPISEAALDDLIHAVRVERKARDARRS
jgi:hypothetical protein